jgi:hypothetical protein
MTFIENPDNSPPLPIAFLPEEAPQGEARQGVPRRVDARRKALTEEGKGKFRKVNRNVCHFDNWHNHDSRKGLQNLVLTKTAAIKVNWIPLPNHENAIEVNNFGETRAICYGFIRLTFLSGEEWKPLLGYDYTYDVSNLGRVRKRCDRTNSIKILKQHGTGHDRIHLSVSLKLNGEKTTKLVHQLVAQVWLPPKPIGLIILHGPLGRRNNCPDNLSYGTYQQNAGADRERDGTLIKGEKSCWAKLTEKDVTEIRKSTKTCRALAQQYGVSAMVISKVKTRKIWKHV